MLFKYIGGEYLMYNVDTITLGINFRRQIFVEDIDGNVKRTVDLNYVLPINEKLKSKLYLDKKNAEIRKREIQRNDYEVKRVIDKLLEGKRRKEKSVYWKGKYGSYSFCYNETWNSLIVTLGHELIKNYTSEEIIANTRQAVINYFGLAEEQIGKITLQRIDIKKDYRCKNKEEKEIIKCLVEKARDKLYTMVKELIEDDEDGYIVKFIARGKSENSEEKETKKGSGYTEIIIYDKEKERKNKRATEEEIKKYKNVVRIEVKIKNKNLNSIEHKRQKKDNEEWETRKDLSKYYNDKFTSKYFSKYIERIFGTNKFYRIDIALQKIEQNKKLKDKKKKKLCKLLKLVNSVGYTKAETIWVKKYCKATFLAEKALIEKMGINILTFNEEINGKQIKAKYIDNFTLLKNTAEAGHIREIA